MSFGWSVGDVVAASKLISEVINSLKEAGGASSAYQELIRELENLDRALKQVDQLQGIEADGIKCAALSCRFIITDFLRSIEKYGKTLAVGSTSAKVAGTARKAQWQTVQKSEVKKLREYVVAHVGTINMMLAHRAVQVATDASEKAGSNHTILSLKLNSIATSLGSSATTAAKTLALGRSMFQKLFDMVRTDVVEPLGALGGTVSNTFVLIQQIHNSILEVKGQLTRVDTNFTYFQAPVQVEDAFGRVFPVPSEYDFGLLVCIIEHQFKDGSAIEHKVVQDGWYELLLENDGNWTFGLNAVALLPGIRIKMAIKQSILIHYRKVEDLPEEDTEGRCPSYCGPWIQKAIGDEGTSQWVAFSLDRTAGRALPQIWIMSESDPYKIAVGADGTDNEG